MDKDKENNGFEGLFDEESSSGGKRGNAASRARNKTVMLTPEIAGQVRAQLGSTPAGEEASVEDLLPPLQEAPSQASPSEELPVSRRRRTDTSEMSRPVVSSDQPAAPAPAATPAPAPVAMSSTGSVQVVASKPSKIVGFFISFDNDEFGEIVEIRHGRWLLTSKLSDHSDQIVINDESISPLHAIVRSTTDGKIQVLDQLSEHGTGITRAEGGEEIDIAGAMETLHHGDTIRFGKRTFSVCILP